MSPEGNITMKKILVALVAVLVASFAFAAAAQAQGQTIEFDPASVDAAGEVEVAVTGTGFDVAVFILPCEGAGGDPAALTDVTTQCDLGALTPASPDADGNISATITFNIPEEGLVIAAGDQAQTNSAIGVITVGAAEEGGEEEGAEEGAEEGGEEEATEEEAPAEEEAEPETTDAEEGELANTGVESGLLAIVGAALLAGGLMTAGAMRRVEA